MKKLIFIFVALFMLVLISGCGARQNTIRYNNGNDTSANVMDATEEPDEEVNEEGGLNFRADEHNLSKQI